MIRLGLRLALNGGRDAAVRLAVVATAVALGVGMLLATLAALNATTTQNDRNAWLNTGHVAAGRGTTAAADPAWWLLRADGFDGRLIGRVDVAATGPDAPVPPGIPRLPGPGQFYASPALAELLRTTPAAELADRYPGRQVGVIGDAALPGPDSLIIVVGRRADQLAGAPGAEKVSAVATRSPASCSGSACAVGTSSNGMDLILSVVAAALIFPVLVLIATATRLSATRREQRFAAMRLIGATPRQVSAVSAAESTVAAALGVAAGFALFLLIRPLLAGIDFTGTPFFPGDPALSVRDVLLVALGVPVAAALSARIALRRVRISPFGVSRRVTAGPPSAYRLVPLAAGLLEIGYFIGRRPGGSAAQVRAFLPGTLLVLAGIVLAGPWLTMVGARLMAARAARPAALVAGRRLADDPKAGFRAVSGLVLALCVTSGAVGVIGALVAERALPSGSHQVRDTVMADYADFRDGHMVGTVATPTAAVLAELRAAPGVSGVTAIHTDPRGARTPAAGEFGSGLADCAQLATMPVFGVCPAGARTASVAERFDAYGLRGRDQWPARWPAAALTPAELDRLPVQQIVVTTDGSTAAIERTRTVLATAYPGQELPRTMAEDRTRNSTELDGYRQLSDVVIAVSFPIAGCSTAVAVAGGLSDRRRPFGLLRLSGVPVRMLQRVVLLESAVPLLVVSAVAIGTGFLTAELFLQAQFGYGLHAPGTEYYLIVAGGIAAALAVIGCTLPLLRRITGPESARNE